MSSGGSPHEAVPSVGINRCMGPMKREPGGTAPRGFTVTYSSTGCHSCALAARAESAIGHPWRR
eukprot:8907493-Pyramimonas_sp.AAC.1